MSARPDKSAKPAQSTAAHFVLQGKGGVGKSLIASLLAQFFMALPEPKAGVKCIDTDPVNQTLVNYKALNAEHLKLMEGSRIDERGFDNLMERILSEDGTFIVDNGASSFVPLSNYLIENNAISMLREAGREVYIHCVITGGQALADTMAGFIALAQQTQSKNIVVWLNEYFGPIEYSGKAFDEMRGYLDNADKVRGIIRIARRNQDTFGRDMQELVAKKLTFNEALAGTDFTIMAKQRLKTMQRDVMDQLTGIGF